MGSRGSVGSRRSQGLFWGPRAQSKNVATDGNVECRTILAILKRDQSSSNSLDRTHRNVVATLATFGLSAMAASGRPEELEPAKAMASIPIARIEPRIVFALSHLLNSRSSFGVIL